MAIFPRKQQSYVVELKAAIDQTKRLYGQSLLDLIAAQEKCDRLFRQGEALQGLLEAEEISPEFQANYYPAY